MSTSYWRNAASLIVVARSSFSQGHKSAKHGSPNVNNATGNENVSMDRPIQVQNASHMQLLMLKRSAQSGFFPNAHIFPGGVIEHADSSFEWVDLYKHIGFQESDFNELGLVKGHRPRICHPSNEDGLPREISLRISAIRETFEESGLLLCRKSTKVKEKYTWTTFISGNHLNSWRQEVRKNPAMFLEMCKQLECYPDIWNLYEWSDWLTPSDIKPRRFDTIFFIAFISSTPNLTEDKEEISHLEWNTPQKLIQASYKGDIYLPPVQLYELSRLANFQTAEEALSFSVNRRQEGIELWLPVRINTTNGILSVLPGDDLYPANPDFEGKTPLAALESSLEELREQSHNHHRFEFTTPVGNLFVNIKQKNKHVGPLKFTDISPKL